MAKKDTLKIEFIGKNAEDVTGSMTVIRDKGLTVLLEAGLYQSNDIYEDYKVNNRKLDLDLKKVDFIILGHVHADHSMLIPRLVAEGCRARIIVPKGTSGFFKILGLDSAYIINRDCETLERKYKKSFHRAYREADIHKALELFEEYEMDEKIELSDRLTVKFTPSGHIVNAAQIELWVKNQNLNKTTKILYTSDLGNISIPKYYATKFERVEKANIVIGECTYANSEKEVKSQARKKDIEKMREVIKWNEGIVEIPIFALDRCPNILTILYEIFGEDENFTTDVVVDSPLAVKMLKEYINVLEGEDLNKLLEVMSWKNLRLIEDGKDSKAYMETAKKCVVLTAAGMLCAGRSRIWLKKIIGSDKNTLLFVGYASSNTIAAKIKNAKGTGSIKIDNKKFPNRCKIVDLRSFTSHMQYNDLINYYSSISADKVCLVHGDFQDKCKFAKALQDEIDKKVGRAKVVVVNNTTSINL